MTQHAVLLTVKHAGELPINTLGKQVRQPICADRAGREVHVSLGGVNTKAAVSAILPAMDVVAQGVSW